MHNAPAVSFPVGRSHLQGGLLCLVVVLGMLTVTVWSRQSEIMGWRHWLAACSCVAISALAGWSWWRTAVGSFSWDGVTWHWSSGARSLRVLPETVLDLQSALLLRLQVADGKEVAWVWLDRVSAPAHWLALRRAVYCGTRLEGDLLPDPENTSPGKQVR